MQQDGSWRTVAARALHDASSQEKTELRRASVRRHRATVRANNPVEADEFWGTFIVNAALASRPVIPTIPQAPVLGRTLLRA